MQHMVQDMATTTSAIIVLAHLASILIHSNVNAGASKSDFALVHSSSTLQHASVNVLWQSNVLLASFSAP